MIVTIHQPHFLPWLGYLHRMAQADLFVLLDHVQFERANYQNRMRIRMAGAVPDHARWITVPVLQRSQKETILEKVIDDSRRWGAASFATLRQAYRDAPYLGAYAAELRRIFEHPWTRLVDLNGATLQFLREAFGIRTPIVRSSELFVSGAKSQLVLSICKAVGATTFLGGLGGSRSYIDTAAFEREGIRVAWQQFRHPSYRQCGAAPFMAGLSSVDLLFNCGERSAGLLLGESRAEAERLAA